MKNGIEMLEVPVYKTEDGKIFLSLEEAKEHNLEKNIERVFREAMTASGIEVTGDFITENLTREILRRKEIILDYIYDYEEEKELDCSEQANSQ